MNAAYSDSLSSIQNGGEGWGEEVLCFQATPLPNPLPAPASRGEGIRYPRHRRQMSAAHFHSLSSIPNGGEGWGEEAVFA